MALPEHLRNRRWINPYVARIEEFPSIVLCRGGNDRPAAAEKLRALRPLYRRLMVELCSGSGGHLLELAKQNPDSLCVGFELRYKRIVRTAEKAKEIGLTNLVMLQDRAENIASYFTAGSLDCVHINFPDPWQKDKWSKHRVLSADFLNALTSLLKVNGTFNYKTDHSARFFEVRDLLSGMPALNTSRYSEDLHSSEFREENIPTEFERLFLSQNKTIFYLQAVRAAFVPDL